MTGSDVDARSYFEPEDLVALASFEARHYWQLARREVVLDAPAPRRAGGAAPRKSSSRRHISS